MAQSLPEFWQSPLRSRGLATSFGRERSVSREAKWGTVGEVLVIPSLFDEPPIIVERPLTPREKWEDFHKNNLHVYIALRQLALDLVDRGFEHYAIATLFEVARWQHSMRTKDETGYKLNNNYRAYYSRLLMENEPRLAGFFETRTLHTVE